MYVGLDISKKDTVGVWMNKEGVIISEGIFATDETGLDTLAKKLRRCEIAIEASSSGVFVHDHLTKKGLSVKVANPNAIKLISQSDKKTDRNDAENLADLLRMRRLPICYMPDQKTREIRDTVRYRKSFVKVNTAIRNRIRAILTRNGLTDPYGDVLGKGSQEWLKEAKLRKTDRNGLNQYLEIALAIEEKITDYEKMLKDGCKENRNAQLLDSLPGIAHTTAMTIASVIGDIKRFPSDEQLASYAGVTPRNYQSGERQYTCGLKKGESSLKEALVESAHAAIRCSKRFKKYYQKKLRKNGKDKQKATIAVARKMVEIIYCMLTRGEPYHEDVK